MFLFSSHREAVLIYCDDGDEEVIMLKHTEFYRLLITTLIVYALVVAPNLTIKIGAQTAPVKNSLQTTVQKPPGGKFPRTYTLASGSAIVYEPQIASWENQKRAVAWTAVAYTPTGSKQAALGTIKIEADTDVALDERLVKLSPMKITEINLPALSREDAQKFSTELQQAMPVEERTISLETALAAVDKSQLIPRETDSRLKADPPKIFSSMTPAILVNFDGEPIWSPIKDTDLKFAVNTNWDVFEHTPTKTFYLRNEAAWMQTTDLNGNWSPAGKLPDSFSKLPADENWKEVKAHIPGKSLAAGQLPKIFVSNEPAELIALGGMPKFADVPGTSLLWVSNTESDLFWSKENRQFYYLVAGRWFSAMDLKGPWTFATPNLPADFKKIPVEHPRSRVLASVPGTDQAAEAVLLATVPQTARVNKKALQAPAVIYQGEPDFRLIENTTVLRAVNTDKDVLQVGSDFYLCYQGVWFHSKTAKGPWTVAESVPEEIYKIPPDSPSYHVTYVTELEDDNNADDWVTFSVIAGYTGMMVGWGCAVWGSGWWYPPYYWYGGFYPIYWWYPRTYGFSAWYNPFTGTFGRGAAVYGPFGGAGAFAAYNPRTGTYARGGAIYGAYGARGFAQAWNPRTGTYAQTRQGSNIYGNWGTSYVQRGDNWARTGRIVNDVNGNRTSGIRTSEGGGLLTRKTDAGRTTIARSGQTGDIYAGRDGNVYRKSDGTWQKWDNGGWNSVEKPKTKLDRRKDLDSRIANQGGVVDRSTINQLDRDRTNRMEAERRSRDLNNYNRNRGGRNSAGSYRGGGGFRGGGFRGGGGRRR
jgi:hypothetical protein